MSGRRLNSLASLMIGFATAFWGLGVPGMVGGVSWAQESAEPVFSGPQVGEAMAGFQVRGVLGPQAGKDSDPVAGAGEEKAVAIVFVHQLTRPSVGLTRAVLGYGSRFPEKLACHVVFLADDLTAMEARIKRAARALPQVAVGISKDGGEGPGAYGLNRKMTLTVIVGKAGKVTANFALIDPSLEADGLKIAQSLQAAAGVDQPPTKDDLGATRPARRDDGQLAPLLRQMINREAEPATVDRIAKKVEELAKADRRIRQDIGLRASRIVNSGRLSQYGTPKAQEWLKAWAEKFGPRSQPAPPEKQPGAEAREKSRPQPPPRPRGKN